MKKLHTLIKSLSLFFFSIFFLFFTKRVNSILVYRQIVKLPFLFFFLLIKNKWKKGEPMNRRNKG